MNANDALIMGLMNHTKKGTAIIATCIVETLKETDPTFQQRFLEKLTRAYDKLNDRGDEDITHELEMLSWVREMLTGWTSGKGQGKPLLGDEQG